MRFYFKNTLAILAAILAISAAGAQVLEESGSGLEESILEELDRMADEDNAQNVKIEETPAPTTIRVRRIKPSSHKKAEVRPPVIPAKKKSSIAIKLDSNDSQSRASKSSANTSPTMTLSEPLAEVTENQKEEKESSWGFSYIYSARANAEKLHERTATISGLNRVSLSYNLDNGIGLTVQPSFFIDYNLEQGNTKHTVGNTALIANKAKLAHLLGFDLDASVRFYLPTGEAWRDTGTNGAFRGDFLFNREVGSGFSAFYLLRPYYYLQSNRSAANFDEYGRLLDNAKANVGLRTLNAVGAGYNFNQVIGVKQLVGIDYLFNYDDPGVGVDGANTSTFDWETSVELKFNRLLLFILSVSQSHEMQSEEGFSLFNTKEMTYEGVISLSL